MINKENVEQLENQEELYFAQCTHCNGTCKDLDHPDEDCPLCEGTGQIFDYLPHLKEYYHYEQD